VGLVVLPILFRDRLVGRIEPRIDTVQGAVQVLAVWWEDGFEASRAEGFVDAMREALGAYLRFAKAERIEWPTELRNEAAVRHGVAGVKPCLAYTDVNAVHRHNTVHRHLRRRRSSRPATRRAGGSRTPSRSVHGCGRCRMTVSMPSSGVRPSSKSQARERWLTVASHLRRGSRVAILQRTTSVP
jgi:hypothetical protein